MKYVYGPINSRRIGLSLGVSLTPHKVCNFDCIYCQLGKTGEQAIVRKEYVFIEDVLSELKAWFQINPEQAKILEYITISGSGEPTLNLKIGELISRIRQITQVNVCVITNSSLLKEPLVRKDLALADLILPSLDAVSEDTFKKIDRPHAAIRIEDIIEGLVSFRKEFRGRIWLEVMLVKGLNDSTEHIEELKAAIERIRPDKIQLNSAVRLTAEKEVLALDKRHLQKIKELLGDNCEII